MFRHHIAGLLSTSMRIKQVSCMSGKPTARPGVPPVQAKKATCTKDQRWALEAARVEGKMNGAATALPGRCRLSTAASCNELSRPHAFSHGRYRLSSRGRFHKVSGKESLRRGAQATDCSDCRTAIKHSSRRACGLQDVVFADPTGLAVHMAHGLQKKTASYQGTGCRRGAAAS